MFGAKLTLIVLTSQRLARIDLAGPRQQLRVERAMSCPAMPTSELAASVAIAYRLGEPTDAPAARGLLSRREQRSVIVLSDDIWNDSISLPLDVTVLLQPAELQQALALEAENYSGIGSFQSKFACRKLLDTSSKLLDASSNFSASATWWVAQLANSDLTSMTTAAKACGFKFVGATHTQACRRATHAEPPLPNDLENQQHLLDFGSHWARALSGNGWELVIRPEDHSVKRHGQGHLQTTAALLTALACAGMYQVRTTELAVLNQQLKQLQQTQLEYDKKASELKVAQAALQQARSRLAATETSRTAQPLLVSKVDRSSTVDALPVDHARWLLIFETLTNETPEECWIESWQSTNNELMLDGRAITAQTIHQLASRLEQPLKEAGWQVKAPIVQADENGLLRFAIQLLRRGQP